jgi:hypothetical protein
MKVSACALLVTILGVFVSIPAYMKLPTLWSKVNKRSTILDAEISYPRADSVLAFRVEFDHIAHDSYAKLV